MTFDLIAFHRREVINRNDNLSVCFDVFQGRVQKYIADRQTSVGQCILKSGNGVWFIRAGSKRPELFFQEIFLHFHSS